MGSLHPLLDATHSADVHGCVRTLENGATELQSGAACASNEALKPEDGGSSARGRAVDAHNSQARSD